MRVYISGPITGYARGNRAAFEVAASALTQFGHVPVNPHEVTDGIPIDSEWTDYMKADLKAMLDCDAVLALDGWELSRGARIEVELALGLGLMVTRDVGRLG